MSEVRLNAESRTEFGKGGARRTRRAGKIPAVIYGHGADPRHVSLPAREFTNAVKHNGPNVLLTLSLEGSEQLAIPKAIQRNPLKGVYEHVDLLAVRRGEKVTIDVPLSVVGTVAPGGLLQQENTSVSVEAEATRLPSEIEVSIDGLEIGSHITAGDLDLPAGASLITDPEQILVLISEAPSEAALEADAAASAAETGAGEQPADDASAASETESDSE